LKRFGLKSSGVISLLLTIGMATGAAGISSAAAAQARAGSRASTKAITVQVSSTVAKPGQVSLEDVSGTVFGTCVGPKSKGTATCVIHVPSDKTVVLLAQPLSRASFKSWAAACRYVPGPVCALFVTSRTRVTASFGARSSKPVAVPTLVAVEGDTSGCSGYLDAEIVNGSGFPANAAVTLKDNGHVVASGTTTGSGGARLSYTVKSEPGIYRSLVMASGSHIAKTDIYNAGSVCSYWNGTGTGTVSFKVVGTDFDAKSKVTVQFGTNKGVIGTADLTGAVTVNTPNYTCKKGTMVNLTITAIRGAKTHFSRSFEVVTAGTC
jgi:hypothetical protein